jgi:hypothetical protein
MDTISIQTVEPKFNTNIKILTNGETAFLDINYIKLYLKLNPLDDNFLLQE